MGDHSLASWELIYGVPQDTILSPVLFNIYMKLLGIIRGFRGKYHQYDDHTQLSLPVTPESGETVHMLDQCLDSVMGWMRASKLKLNPGMKGLWMNGF